MTLTARLTVTIVLMTMSLATAASTTFTYQGRLDQSDAAFTGTVDLEFRIYNSVTGCCQQGTVQTRNGWPVVEGLFQVDLDFGNVFAGDRWLEIRVDGVTLEPRQPVRPAPTAMHALGPWQLAGNSGIQYSDASVSIGTTPNSTNRLRVRAAHGSQNALNVIDHDGITRLRVAPNGGVAVGTNQAPPAGGLRVGTQAGIGTAPRQQLSVGDRLDLYSGPRNDPLAPSIRGNPATSNLVISAIDNGALFFNFDAGSGGVRFHNGTGSGGELMRLTGGGTLGIGISNPDPGTALHVVGHVAIGDAPTNIGTTGNDLNVSGRIRMGDFVGSGNQDVCRNSITGLLASCDSTAFAKKNITDLELVTDWITALRPVRFSWISNNKKDIGLVAEQVATVLPELVFENNDGEITGINYRHLTAVLVKAIQEQQSENAVLNARLTTMESQVDLIAATIRSNDELESRLAALEALLMDQPTAAQHSPTVSSRSESHPTGSGL